MIADLKPYPSMKNSGVPCIGGKLYSLNTGYQLSLTRYFYKPQPLLALEEGRTEILALERETKGSLREITFGGAV